MHSLMRVCGKEIKVEGWLLRIARLYGDEYKFLEDPEPLLDGLRKSKVRIDLFTFMQRTPETSPKYSYPMEWVNFAALPVSTFEHWWTRQIHSNVRRKVRKAEKKGVVSREVAFDTPLVQGIWEVFNECPIRQGRPFRHYGKDIETVYRMEATFLDSSIFIGAFLSDSLIGFTKLVLDETRKQASVMNIVSMVRHWDKAPTNALVTQAVRTCAERGIRYLVYGPFTDGKKQWDGFTIFKQHNGFQRIDLPRYYVPLTRIGWAAFRLGLHHRLADQLPEALVAKLRALRSAWYDRKFHAVREAS